jgi:hypothetical protein
VGCDRVGFHRRVGEQQVKNILYPLDSEPQGNVEFFGGPLDGLIATHSVLTEFYEHVDMVMVEGVEGTYPWPSPHLYKLEQPPAQAAKAFSGRPAQRMRYVHIGEGSGKRATAVGS